MLKKLTLEYTEKHHVLELDGKEYEIPQRTVGIAKALAVHDEKISKMSEYESNMELLEILFGRESAKEMFPEGEDTNLDKLAKCCKIVLAAFYADLHEITEEEKDEQLKKLDPILNRLEKAGGIVDKAGDIVTEQKKRQRKR